MAAKRKTTKVEVKEDPQVIIGDPTDTSRRAKTQTGTIHKVGGSRKVSVIYETYAAGTFSRGVRSKTGDLFIHVLYGTGFIQMYNEGGEIEDQVELRAGAYAVIEAGKGYRVATSGSTELGLLLVSEVGYNTGLEILDPTVGVPTEPKLDEAEDLAPMQTIPRRHTSKTVAQSLAMARRVGRYVAADAATAVAGGTAQANAPMVNLPPEPMDY